MLFRSEAQTQVRLALAEGTQDARLFLHAAVILARTGKLDEAAAWFGKATALKHLLLPSEKVELQSVQKLILRPNAARVDPAGGTAPKPFPVVASSGPTAGN